MFARQTNESSERNREYGQCIVSKDEIYLDVESHDARGDGVDWEASIRIMDEYE